MLQLSMFFFKFTLLVFVGCGANHRLNLECDEADRAWRDCRDRLADAGDYQEDQEWSDESEFDLAQECPQSEKVVDGDCVEVFLEYYDCIELLIEENDCATDSNIVELREEIDAICGKPQDCLGG